MDGIVLWYRGKDELQCCRNIPSSILETPRHTIRLTTGGSNLSDPDVYGHGCELCRVSRHLSINSACMAKFKGHASLERKAGQLDVESE